MYEFNIFPTLTALALTPLTQKLSIIGYVGLVANVTKYREPKPNLSYYQEMDLLGLS